MLGASRRSLSAVARFRGAASYRALSPSVSSSELTNKREDKGFAHPEKIQMLVKNYSQFVSFPIYTWQEKGHTKEVEVEEDPTETKKERIFPEFLDLSFKGRLKPLLDELHEMNFSHAEIRAMILENPKPFLRLEAGELSRCIAFLDSLRCRHPIKERILNRGYLRATINVKLRIECLHKHGLILRDAFKVLYVEPRAILYDLADIEEKIEFLLHKMRFCIEHLVECPEYLGVNLDKQIIPRYNVFEYLRSVGGLGDEVWMKHYVKLSRMKFYNMFVKPYPDCEKIFKGFRREKIASSCHPVGMWKLFKPQKFPESDKDVRNMKKFVKTLNLR